MSINKELGQTQELFHEYFERLVNQSKYHQAEMAKEIGVKSPNIITMFKQGKTRIPLDKIPKLARILGVDPKSMLRRAMLEYCPETLKTVESTFEISSNTKNEQKILDEIRRLSNGSDPAITSIRHQEAIEEFVKVLTK